MESGDAAGGMLPSVDADTLKQAMGAWTTGVVVVTASHADGRDAGLVMVSLAPVSVDPPLVLLFSGVAPTVTQAAMDVGCGHLSRFAAFYRERFGELPSETR